VGHEIERRLGCQPGRCWVWRGLCGCWCSPPSRGRITPCGSAPCLCTISSNVTSTQDQHHVLSMCAGRHLRAVTVGVSRKVSEQAPRRQQRTPMGCAGSSPARDPNDLSRPADVPCPSCGAFNYLQAGVADMACFKCKSLVTRSAAGATGLQSTVEARDEQRDRADELNPNRYKDYGALLAQPYLAVDRRLSRGSRRAA